MPSTNSSQTVRIARCQVAGRTFGLDMSAIVGIQPSEVVRFDSTSTDEVIGSITSQGRQFPVYSLARLLGLPSAPTRTGHCIVATDGVDVWGLLTDRVSHSESRTAREVVPLPALITGSAGAMIRGVLCGTGEQTLPLIVLDLEQLRPRSQPSPVAETQASATPAVPREVVSSFPSTQRRLVTFAPASAPAGSNLRYAFSVTQVVEITRVPESIALPGSPAFVQGISVWRHSPLPLVRLTASECRVGHEGGESDRMAVVRVPECDLPLGLLVSPECEILTCPVPGTVLSASHIGVPDHSVRAVFQREHQTLLFPRFSPHSMTV